MWAGVSSTTESVALDGGGYRERGGTTVYNESPAPQPIRTEESGWLDDSIDDRCSVTDFVDPAVPDETGTWMWVYPEANRVVEGPCDAEPLGDVLSESETAYDGLAVGAPPTQGNVTFQRSRIDGTRWAETTTTFDALGRPTVVEQENGAQDPTTTTAYTGAAVNLIPTQTVVTQENGANDLVTTTTYEPEKGGPATITDPNGNLSSFHYDQFHRLDGVRLETERGLPGNAEDNRSWRFAYLLSEDKTAPPVVRSEQLASVNGSGVGHYETTWAVYDGLLRDRQTQTLSPTAGDVVVDLIRYDDQGRVLDKIAPQAVTGTPGVGYLVPPNAAWENTTRHHYDELGRATEDEQIAVHSGGTDTTTTSYAYTDDTVTVTGPTEARSREVVDGLGRTAEAAEWDDADDDRVVDAGEWATASYVYDLADRLLSVTDPSGNGTAYGYNLAGWRTSQDDPDRGEASYEYDLVGNLRMSEDALGTQLWTSYDVLGRPTARREGSDTGTLLASWDYDTATLGLGMAASSTRHTSGGDWTTAVSGYDGRGRALGSTLTVPAGVAGLSGAYSVTQAYDRADRPTATTYGAAGDLAGEVVTTTYDSLGMAYSLAGAEDYVAGAGYDGRGRPGFEVYGPPDPSGPLSIWQARFFEYNTDQQLSGIDVYNAAATATPNDWVNLLDRELSFDDAGNLVERASTVAGLGSSRECFDYDSRMRLVGAWTVDLSGAVTCAGGTKGSGDEGYERHYAYEPDGRIASRSEAIAPTSGDLITYTYPSGTAPDQPHAPTGVGPDSYSWDDNGNMATRTIGGTAETLGWDDEQRLALVDGPGGDDTSFV
jgi:YD repeat-containing protein